ncbi:ABC transporter B family member 6 [Gracilariopsis chorda]|uniref:Probable ATP-dependent transporter ycf16 n=1 Tax=Gracilariopsis chorda TaxID=448386 RepID=A0A2V3IZZ2_9FLOR|nr:ABC transporter B family member 6 [Gracilariopsis chorda]|eukprot:PXF47708.1 ABC transporter B family member 6 [Gracilariopsis chorda]
MEREPLLKKRKKSSVPDDGRQMDMSFAKTMTFCLPFIMPNTLRLKIYTVLAILCITGYKACLLIPGLSMKIVVDALASDDKRIRSHRPILGLLLFLGGRALGGVLGQGQEMAQEYCTSHMSKVFAVRSFSHIQSLSLSYHTNKNTGETTSILGRGIGSIGTLLRLVVFSLGPTVVEAIFVAGIFFKLGSPLIALVTLITVITYVFFTAYMTRWRVRCGRQLREAQNNAWACATETILHFGTVKSFGMEETEVSRYAALWEIAQAMTLRSAGILTGFKFGQNFIVHLGTFFGLIIAAVQASRHVITIGDFTMIQSYIGQLFGPLLWFGNSFGQVVSALTNLEQVMELFDKESEVQDVEGAEELKFGVVEGMPSTGDVVFENVSFGYEKVLSSSEGQNCRSGQVRNISFRVPAGKMLALVGPSGAGKSTLVKLLLRLYDPDEGRILVSGRDVKYLKQNSLRHAMGLVAQETTLFNDTLEKNIRFGRPDASEAEVWSAICLASLEEFVRKQTHGLQTRVGDQGLRLSGGERQRVGIARAVLKDPAIMLLDEATSALSTLDERKIQKNLQQLCKGRTTIAVAHRLSTVMMADEILVINNGHVIEHGNHSELVSRKGLYAHMWRLQAGTAADENEDEDFSITPVN